MRVVINGGAGFIGLALLEKLKAASVDISVADTPLRIERVRGLLRDVELIPGDLNAVSFDHLKTADTLVHLAWSSQPSNSMSAIAEDANSNIVGSVKLFERALAAGIETIIFASSGGTVYGNTNQLPIVETAPLAPVSAYGVSKLAVERYLQLMSFHAQVKGISLRVGNPYGPYQLHGVPIGLIANFLLQLGKGNPLRIYGDGQIVRDYVWIGDVADAFLSAIQLDIPSGEYNIGSGYGYSINEIANLIQEVSGTRSDRTYVDHRSFDAQKVVLSVAKFTAATNWHPNMPIKEGLNRMLEAMKDLRT